MTKTTSKRVGKRSAGRNKTANSSIAISESAPIDFSEWPDEDYLKHFRVEPLLSQALSAVMTYKPDNPTRFLYSYLKLTTTKDYPYSLPILYQLKTILRFVRPFDDSTARQFHKNIQTTYSTLQRADRINIQTLCQILEISSDEKIIPYSQHLVQKYLLQNSSPGEPLERQVFSYCTTEALKFIHLLETILEKYECLVHRYQHTAGSGSVSVLSKDYYTIPKSVVRKLVKKLRRVPEEEARTFCTPKTLSALLDAIVDQVCRKVTSDSNKTQVTQKSALPDHQVKLLATPQESPSQCLNYQCQNKASDAYVGTKSAQHGGACRRGDLLEIDGVDSARQSELDKLVRAIEYGPFSDISSDDEYTTNESELEPSTQSTASSGVKKSSVNGGSVDVDELLEGFAQAYLQPKFVEPVKTFRYHI